MTIAKDFASKAAVAFVALAMIFTMSVPASNAQQSSEDLQKMINDLLAQIATLQAQAGQGSATASGYTWTRDLKTGATGADVMELQKFLNADADTRVAATGVGSAGMETSYFGPATAAAVSKFQVKYRADILSPAGLVNPTGFFGPSTRAKANALNTVTTTPDEEEEEGSTDEEEEEEESQELSGEATLDTFELEDGESTVDESDEDAEIGVATVEFTDGDASISRLDVSLVSDDTTANPWDAFDTVSLWVDGEKVAEVDASDEDKYLDEDAGELRFTGLDIVATEDDSLDITVAATIQNNLDAAELSNWTLTVTSMRYFDADGVATTDTDTDGISVDTSEFEIQEAGTDEELDLSLSSSNPDSTDVVVDTDTDTNGVTILSADIEATDGDIDLNRVVVKVDTTNGTTTDVVDEVRVVIDGQTFKAESIGTETDYLVANAVNTGITEGYSEKAAATTSVWYLFDIDGDVTVDEDDTVTMDVVVDLNDTDDAARYPNGTTIKASITSVERALIDAEGADTLTSGQLKGTAVGDTHTLVAEGIVVPVDGFSSEISKVDADGKVYQFQLEFDVTAVEGDFYITNNATDVSSTTLADGVGYSVTGGTATVTASLASTANEDTDDVFTVREGDTETFTVTVTVDPVANGTFRVQLDEVWFSANENGTTSAEAYYPTPVSDFRTTSQSIIGA